MTTASGVASTDRIVLAQFAAPLGASIPRYVPARSAAISAENIRLTVLAKCAANMKAGTPTIARAISVGVLGEATSKNNHGQETLT